MRPYGLAVGLLGALALAVNCGAPGPGPGGPSDDPDAGSDGGGPITAPAGTWTWIPVEGSRCASGATAGIGVNLSSTSDDLFIYLQGGGACWNQGTCTPSPLRYGPICYYNPNICLYDGPGGTQPTSTHVTAPDPFPADGGGAFPAELSQLTSVRAFDRTDPLNPFRDATFVFVPYCTGDLHSGSAVRTYPYTQYLGGPTLQYTFHFAGAANMERYLERLFASRPAAQRIWLTGSSAGGYGATFHFARVQARFPQAEVSLLADSAPFVNAPLHWTQWQSEWAMQFPAGCTACDGGFPEVVKHLATAFPDRRLGLLAFDHDRVLSYYFFGGDGLDPALNPPTGAYAQALSQLQAVYDGRPNLEYFVLPGEEHVLWGGYGMRLADGGYTAPRPSADGGTDLKTWIDTWATGASGWQSVR